MSIKVDAPDPTPRIAARVRAERIKRDWSLDQLSRNAGVSKAMLSKLERAEASPTASLLGKISGAFGVTLASLLVEQRANPARTVTQSEQPTWRDPETGYLRRQVSPLTDLPVQLVEVELPPGVRVPFPASAYAFIRQLVWILSGKLDLQEGQQMHHLSSGDCLELGDPSDCVFTNSGAKVCRYLVVVCRR